MNRRLMAGLGVMVGLMVCVQTLRGADPPKATVTEVTRVSLPGGKHDYTASGTFPKLPDGTRIERCNLEIRWVDDSTNPPTEKRVETPLGRGPAANGNPGTFSGSVQGIDNRPAWRPQIRVRIYGTPVGGTQSAWLTEWSDWKYAD